MIALIFSLFKDFSVAQSAQGQIAGLIMNDKLERT
jgi:hypothetical protein